MPRDNYLIFPDGDDWLIFSPADAMLIRGNEACAHQYWKKNEAARREDEVLESSGPFEPVRMTVSAAHVCRNRCVYCYGQPSHGLPETLNLDFCAAAADFIAGNAAKCNEKFQVFFHGVGEPLHAWQVFRACVDRCEQAASDHGVELHKYVCTSGQVTEAKRAWVADNFDVVDVSFDGLPELQRLQRPRADGADPVEAPLDLARKALVCKKKVNIKVTVTTRNVDRMAEIVDYCADALPGAKLQFGMVFAMPWTDEVNVNADVFVARFIEALQAGRERGMAVGHPEVNLSMLLRPRPDMLEDHVCLAAPDKVIAFYDVPGEPGRLPRLGAYGYYDVSKGVIVWDHEERLRLQCEQTIPQCRACPLRFSCFGAAGVKGRMASQQKEMDNHCAARIGVLRELLRGLVLARTQGAVA